MAPLGWSKWSGFTEGMCRGVRKHRHHAHSNEGPGLLDPTGDNMWVPTATAGVSPQLQFLAPAPVPLASRESAFLCDPSPHLHWAVTSLLNTSVAWLLPPPFLSSLRSSGFCITVASVCAAFSLRAGREEGRGTKRERETGRERNELI